MPLPRSSQVSLEATPYYHVISRCVRRQFLCGFDRLTGKDFTHRRDWIRTRIFELTEIFAIRVCGYAVMSTHFHLVLRVEQQRALEWDDREVARRWAELFSGRPEVRRFEAGEPLTDAEKALVATLIPQYRQRLFDLSWFMRCLNEPIARMANAEDKVSGRFWEGRFKSQAILDEAALVATMAYVDLNPIRARMAETPEGSDYTSIQQRILEQDPALKREKTDPAGKLPEDLQAAIGKLMPFFDHTSADRHPENPGNFIPYELRDYLELVDWTGRAIAPGKKGSIPDSLPPIFQRLKLNPDQYLLFIRRHQKSRFGNFIGPAAKMRELAEHFQQKFLRGQAVAARLFSPG